MAMNPQFRRSAAAETRNKGKKGGRGAWFEKFRIPKDTPTPFALISSEYVDPCPPPEQVEVDPGTGRPREVKNAYFKFKRHKRSMVNGGRQFFADEVCSAGYDQYNPQPCVGCHAMDLGDKSVTVADQFAFGLVHLAFYHGHPVMEANGSMMMSKKDAGVAVLNYDPCTGRTCNYCRVMRGEAPIAQQGEKPWPGYDPRLLTTVFGQRKYIEIGKGHLSDLMTWDQQISNTCAGCQGELTTDGFSCPTCNGVVINMSDDTRSDEEIREAVGKPYPCLQCRRPVYLREDTSCANCTPRGLPVTQQGVFDVVLQGMRSGEGTNSHLVLSKWKTIEEFEKTIDPGFLQGKNLRSYIAEMGKPYEFADIFSPRSMQDQAKRLELSMPPSAGQAAASHPYQGAPPPQSHGAPAPYGQQQGYAPTPQAPAGPTPYVPPGRPNYNR